MDLKDPVSRWSGRALLAGSLVALLAVLTLADHHPSALTFVEVNGDNLYAQGGSGNFAALDTQSGSRRWVFEDSHLRLFTKAVFGSGSVFVAATSADLSKSQLIRVNANTGKEDWRVPLEGLGGNAAPVLCDGEVLAADYWRRTVSAFNVVTGKNDWTTEALPHRFLFPPAILGRNAIFVVADREKPEEKQELMSISCQDGQVTKAMQVQLGGGVSRTPVLLYKDSAILSAYDRSKGTSLKALKMEDGTQLWSAQIPDEIMRFSPALQNNLLVASGSSVWILNLDTGKTVFRETLPIASVPVATGNGLVFLSRGTHTVEARELPSGKLRWKTTLKDTISSNFVVARNRAYVKTGTNQIAVLTMAGEVDGYLRISDSPGQAGSSKSSALGNLLLSTLFP